MSDFKCIFFFFLFQPIHKYNISYFFLFNHNLTFFSILSFLLCDLSFYSVCFFQKHFLSPALPFLLLLFLWLFSLLLFSILFQLVVVVIVLLFTFLFFSFYTNYFHLNYNIFSLNLFSLSQFQFR